MAHGAPVPRIVGVREAPVIDPSVARVAHGAARKKGVPDRVASVRSFVARPTCRANGRREMALVAEHKRNPLRREHDRARSRIGVVRAGGQPRVRHGAPVGQRTEAADGPGGFRNGCGRGQENGSDEQYPERRSRPQDDQPRGTHLTAPWSP